LSPLSELTPSIKLDLLCFIAGACIGSFLNVLALRTLAEESILYPPSHCPRCQGPISILDNIPIISWLILRGRCRCCAAPISWQYPLVELATGAIFVAIERVFLSIEQSPFNNSYFNHLLAAWFRPEAYNHLSLINDTFIIHRGPATAYSTLPQNDLIWLAAGALFLACTLIAVSITDFREKLIPHDITYPAMLVGIFYSACVRHDLLGAMAGIGASYILFDFIAFYGLKVYLMTHAAQDTVRTRILRRMIKPRRRRRISRALRWRLDLATIDRTQEQEPIEVMGGGDAVLSAVMAAFLGWQLLVVSLILGFIFGTLMGLGLLVVEMRKANLLHKCLRTSAITGACGGLMMGALGMFVDHTVFQSISATAIPMSIVGILSGVLLGVVAIGTRVSKPYPFGPALAAGGMISIFLLPNWLYLNSIAAAQH
jgi:prepilin signal peptidase PulO-like enzyme (type II secretory pathway)